MPTPKLNILGLLKLLFNEVFIGMILAVVVPTVLLGVIASGSVKTFTVVGGIFLISLLQITSNVLNNYVDWEIDRINKKRVLMHQVVGKNWLLLLAAVLFLMTVPFFVYGNIYLKITMLIAYFVIINYNFVLKAKDVLFLNYLFIAFSYGPLAFAIGFFFSSLSINGFSMLLWIPLFIFFFNMGFVVIKDYGDIEGDKAEGKMTLPVVIGRKLSLIYQFVLITAIFGAMIYFGVTALQWNAVLLLLIPYLIAIYTLSMVISPKDKSAYSKASDMIRVNALIVMIVLALYFFR